MPHDYTSEGAEVPADSFTIPDGEYILRVDKVKEGKSKNDDYQVTCSMRVADGERKGFPVNYHRVTFLNPAKNPKAAGMSIHWLKVLGQPWEGKFKIYPEDWIGKCFLAYLAAETFNGFESMKVKWVKALDKEQLEQFEMTPREAAQARNPEVDEEVPF